MILVKYNDQSYTLTKNENLLQCFLRHGVDYQHSCQMGICQSCLIKASKGDVEPLWQAGLPETLKSQGYFLACLAKPTHSIDVTSPNQAECEVPAQIFSLEELNYNVMQVKIKVEECEPWRPGQYLSLINSLGTMRNYSIANIPVEDGYIELHVKIISDGDMSRWLIQKKPGDTNVMLRGPFGSCFYDNPNQLPFDILLAGTGTGLAPLIGILKSALSQNHQGRITLIHGGVIDKDIYYQQELERLAFLNDNFYYDQCVLEGSGLYPKEPIQQRVRQYLSSPNSITAYVCGPKVTTQQLKTSIFLAGIPSTRIYSDIFLST